MDTRKTMDYFSMDYFSLKGKVAMVTGGNTNLGMAYCVAFAKAGADIFVPHYEADVSLVKELVEAEGRKIEFLRGDLTSGEYRQELIEACMRSYGRIDILVNNAGAAIFNDFQQYPEKAWRTVVDLNLTVPFLLSQAVSKIMKEQGGGKIINIGSSLSFQADCGSGAYAPTKAGILGLTRMLCQELAQYNIQCNAICPGWFSGPMDVELCKHDNFINYINEGIPARRWGYLDDLMGTAVFLASKASDYINGWPIHVDGGKSSTFAPEIKWAE